MFVKNEGKNDRALRIFVGLLLLSLMFFGPQTLWGLIGLVPFITGLFGYCPLYKLFGYNTCPLKS
jgi:hypothetical protein